MNLPKIPQRTTPGFSFSIVERSLLECIAERRFSKEDAELTAAYFGHTCAFCGRSMERWDHLVPISRGGDTVIGNMVPTCAKCDDSKKDHPYTEWARGRAPNSPTSRSVLDVEERLNRIREYVEKYAYRAKEPQERLTPEELTEYEQIKRDLSKARDDIDTFLRLYRERTGRYMRQDR